MINEELDVHGALTWRSWFGLPVALVVLHALISWIGRAPGILTGEDDVRYIILGRAIKIGEYRELWAPGMPEHHMYPPGYPALLAAWTSVGGNSFSSLVALQLVLSVATLGFTFDALRRVVSPAVAMGSLCVLAVNPYLIRAAGTVMSESPLAFCFAVALWASVSMPRGARQSALVLTAAALAPMMRTAGVVLPAAVLVHLLLGRRWRDAALAFALFVVTIGPLFAWTMADPVVSSGESYAADLAHKGVGLTFRRTVLDRVARNFVFYFTQGLPLSLPAPTIAGTRVDNAIVSLVIGASLAVGLAVAVRGLRLAMLTLLAMGGLLATWPWPVVRYLVPALPLIVPVLLLGTERLGLQVSRRVGFIAVVAVAAVISLTGAVQLTERIASRVQCDYSQTLPDSRCMSTDQASFFSLARYVRDSLPPDARLLAAKAAPLYYYTNRQTFPAAQVVGMDTARFWLKLRRDRAEYVVLGALHNAEWPRLADLLAQRCKDLTLLAAFPPRTYLFRLGADASGARDSAAVRPRDNRACAAIRQYQLDNARNPY